MNPPRVSPLTAGTSVRGYRVVKVISRGGFSVVYGAVREKDGRPVALKEYYPVSLARREAGGRIIPLGERERRLFDYARRLFFQESALLAGLHHPHIVPVLDFFHAHGTVYSVMAYFPGVTLQQILRHRRRGGLPEEGILRVFGPICEGLALLHENGLVHLDVKPGNVYLRREGGPMLLDFGAAGKARPIMDDEIPVVSEGYSPPEQLERGGEIGPWSDLYAVGASMRACMEGHAPLSSRQRRERDDLEPAVEALAGHYSVRLLEAVDWVMALDPHARPGSVEEFLDAWPKWKREVA